MESKTTIHELGEQLTQMDNRLQNIESKVSPNSTLIRSHELEKRYGISATKRKQETNKGSFEAHKLGGILFYDTVQTDAAIKNNKIG